MGIAEVLPGADVAKVRGEPREILALLEAHAPDVVFNLCEAPLGRPELEPHVAALLEWAGVRFTGSGSETLALCRRKDRVAAVLAGAGVPVPQRGADSPASSSRRTRTAPPASTTTLSARMTPRWRARAREPPARS